MHRHVLALAALIALAVLAAAPAPARGQAAPPEIELVTRELRPLHRFTPAFGWMNDPNGLVFVDGEWHLFYQYNPFAVSFGTIGWGHAISTDLVHWDVLPIALPASPDRQFFSGSAVIDAGNTSGLCEPGVTCLVAVYTENVETPGLGRTQRQALASSNDRGRSWRFFEGNPVLDLGLADFRDPKVIWHEPTQRWVMAIALPIERRIAFYASPNLREWSFLSDFGPAGAVGGAWECPDLIELPVEGAPAERLWVLAVSTNPGHVAGGSGMQYFVGRFDGTRFERLAPTPEQGVLWVDHGKDFYCATRWYTEPGTPEAPTWIAWMNDWLYAADIPTYPWRGSMSLPRRLRLVARPEGVRLAQRPVEMLARRRGPERRAAGADVEEVERTLGAAPPDAFELVLDIEPGAARAIGVRLLAASTPNPVAVATIGWDAAARELFVVRHEAGNRPVGADFPGERRAPLEPEGDPARVRLHVVADRNGIEVFAQDGLGVVTELLFPVAPLAALDLFAEDGAPARVEASLWPLVAQPIPEPAAALAAGAAAAALAWRHWTASRTAAAARKR